MRRFIALAASFAVLSIVVGSTASQAAWEKIYGFDKNGSSFDVVLTMSGDSLNDLFSGGYDAMSLSGFSSVLSVLDVGTLASTSSLQDHLIRGMMELSGYDPFSNPGQVIFIYNGNVDHRYLYSNYNGGIAENQGLRLGRARGQYGCLCDQSRHADPRTHPCTVAWDWSCRTWDEAAKHALSGSA